MSSPNNLHPTLHFNKTNLKRPMSHYPDFPSECDQLLKDLSSYQVVQVSRLEDLKSGMVLIQLLSSLQSRPEFLKLVSSKSSITIPHRWKLIQDYMKLNYIWTIEEFYPEEIINDKGILYLLTKNIIKVIGRPKKKTHRRIISYSIPNHSPLTKSNSAAFNQFNGDERTNEDGKIFDLLQDLRIINFATLAHDFVNKARTGLALFDVVKKVDRSLGKEESLVVKPEGIEDCLMNLNKVLRFLRLKMKNYKKSLYVSDKVYQGDRETIFRLLNLVYEFYIVEKEDMGKSSKTFEKSAMSSQSISSVKASNSSYSSPSKIKSVPDPISPSSSQGFEKKVALSTSDKYSIIDWISSLGLLDRLVSSENPIKSTLQNGVLLCEVINKVYSARLHFIKTPKSFLDCEQNFLLGIDYLSSKLSLNILSDFSIDEETTFVTIFKIMNSSRERVGIVDQTLFKQTESSLIAWLKSGGLIEETHYSIFSLVPEFQSGELLVKIVNCLVESYERVSRTSDPIQNITSCFQILQKKSLMNQRYTSNVYELYRGEIFFIVSLLEDLHEFSIKSKKSLKAQASRPISQFDSKSLKNMEFWIVSKGIQIKTLSGEELKEFKSGEKICEILNKVFGANISPISNPKNCAEATYNIRQAFHFLFSRHNFPIKYKYLDDLISAGDGETIRSLITDLMQII